MSRIPLPFYSEDISALARSLNGQLAHCEHTPGHVDLLNMLARATGCRNFQHFRAQSTARQRLAAPPPVAEPVDLVRVQRWLRHFDAEGQLLRWPGKFSDRQPCLWVLWSRLPPRQTFTEAEISRLLQEHHRFGDHALLRRELVDGGWMTRTADGRVYRRLERRPPPEALALIRYLSERQAA
jgi:hypothetical protein